MKLILSWILITLIAFSSCAFAATMGESNALKSAESYLEYSAFSYEGLIDQLEYEGYSHSEAVYAVDNCGADWYEEAVESAKEYLEYSSFSRSGLIGQLEYEGFTHDQAVYGVDQNGYVESQTSESDMPKENQTSMKIESPVEYSEEHLDFVKVFSNSYKKGEAFLSSVAHSGQYRKYCSSPVRGRMQNR